jgi:hypothetical protein
MSPLCLPCVSPVSPLHLSGAAELPPLRKPAAGARALASPSPSSSPNPNPNHDTHSDPHPRPNPSHDPYQALEPSPAGVGRGAAHGASPGGQAGSFFPCTRQGRLQLPLPPPRPPPRPAADEGGAIASDGRSRPGLAASRAGGLAAAPAASLRSAHYDAHPSPGPRSEWHALPGVHATHVTQPRAASACADAEAAAAEARAEAGAGVGAGAGAEAGGLPAEAAAQWLLDEFGARSGPDLASEPAPHHPGPDPEHCPPTAGR